MSVADAPIVTVGRALAERGHYGIIWFDQDFSVTARFGRLVGFVKIGEHITQDLPVLIGVEKDIFALKDCDTTVLEMPAVAIVSPDGATPRLNLLVFWVTEEASYLCLVTRTGIGSDTEVELAKEIRRRLIAEVEVVAKSRQLARANQDLEEYAAVISHDLQSPMRALRYQIEDLEQALDAALTDDVASRLRRMKSQARRMGNMLSALLEYSTIGKKSEALSDVDTSALLNAIIASFKQSPTRKFTITGTWPVLKTLEQPLDLVLRNLIDNAIKHHHGGDVEIQIHATDKTDRFEFEIRDNGPGVAPEHKDAIFLPFRTLKQSDGEEVHGLGLALVNRIITDVGGEIRVVARTDDKPGAVFQVDWPKEILD